MQIPMRQKLWSLARLEERGTASKGSTTRAGPENSARLGVEVGVGTALRAEKIPSVHKGLRRGGGAAISVTD